MSVVIGSHGRTGGLARAVTSALAQSFSDREVIVVEYASGGDAAAVVGAFGDQVRYVRHAPQDQPGLARQAALAGVRGDLVAFLDGDDRWLLAKLERQVALLDRHAAVALVSTSALVDRDGVVSARPELLLDLPRRGRMFELLARRNFVIPSTVLVRRSALDEAAGVGQEHLADLELWLRIAARHELAFLPEPLAVTRHPSTAPGASLVDCLRVTLSAARRGRPELEGRSHRTLDALVHVLRRQLIDELRSAGRPGEALAQGLRLVGSRPNLLVSAAARAIVGTLRGSSSARPASRPSSALTELVYLRPALEELARRRPSAVDVGAHRGVLSHELCRLGFRVLALEPNPCLRPSLEAALSTPIREGQAVIVEVAASDRPGTSTLVLGAADTLSSLERSWPTTAFPEHFQTPREVEVRTAPLAQLLVDRGVTDLGFVKIDTEGHEASVLRGLLAEGVARPDIVMFEANQRLPETATECLDLLRRAGYDTFDAFVQAGEEVLATARFSGPGLPSCWRRYGSKYFFANLIAYAPGAPRPGVDELERARERSAAARAEATLARVLEIERQRGLSVHEVWSQARRRIRSLFPDGLRAFLRDPVCRTMFYRTGWGAAQEHELEVVTRTPRVGRLLREWCEPIAGGPEATEEGRPPTNALGMLYYLARLETWLGAADFPRQVIEVGGGYGALCAAYGRLQPECSYTIVDLPEMLALQEYFLSLTQPEREVVLCTTREEVQQAPGRVLLVPASVALSTPLLADVFISTFALSEMPRALQEEFERTDLFGCEAALITGQLPEEAPSARWSSHGGILGAAAAIFAEVRVERFHIGQNYLLLARRSRRPSDE